MTTIAEPSVKSLLIRMEVNDQPLSIGTAFVAESKKGPVLITNWHNAAGRNPKSGQIISVTGAVPDTIVVLHNQAGKLGQWVHRKEPLQAKGKKLWFEHPTHGNNVDCVAIPLTDLKDVQLYPYTLGNTDPAIRCGPADPVSVVGFP